MCLSKEISKDSSNKYLTFIKYSLNILKNIVQYIKLKLYMYTMKCCSNVYIIKDRCMLALSNYKLWCTKDIYRRRRRRRRIPVAIMLSPGASIPPGGRMKQLFGAVVWNCNGIKNKNNKW